MKTCKERAEASVGAFAMVIFLFVAFLLRTCTGTTQTTTPVSESAGSTKVITPTVEPPPVEGVHASSFRIAMEPIVQIDPALISSDSEVLVAGHVYDSLVDVSPQNMIVPRLTAEWKTSEDGLTFVFQFFPGVAFHDDSPLTPEDGVWTFNRHRDPDA